MRTSATTKGIRGTAGLAERPRSERYRGTVASTGPGSRPPEAIGTRLASAPSVTACSGADVSGGYRMTRYQRLAMTVIVAAAVVVAAITLLWHPTSVATTPVTVMPGDTITSIAHRALPEMDVADARRLILNINGLGSDIVVAGAVLNVPSR